jgi:nucleotide-binding universal stress UspA family protein
MSLSFVTRRTFAPPDAMYSRILVATDGSPTADKALAEAIQLAKTTGATLRVVHAVDSVYMSVEPELVSLRAIKEAQAKAGREILDRAEAQAKAQGVRVETRLHDIERLDQRIVDVIADEAASWPAELLVVGTHGRRGLHRLLLGSVAEGLVRIVSVPVLLVRDAGAAA